MNLTQGQELLSRDVGGKGKSNMILVKNLNGTGDNLPNGYSSWKDFWIAKKGYWPNKCSAYGCYGRAELGAHVIKVNGNDKSWYIVPLCFSHNKTDSSFYVDESMLVPVR